MTQPLASNESARLSYDEARALTAKINAAGTELAEMIFKAHEEKAWGVLGYPDWKSYVAAELKISKQRSFQLIDFAKVKQAISESTTVDSIAPTSEGQVRPLAKLETPEAQREAWAEAVEESGGQPTAKHVEAAVERRIIKAEALEPEAQARVEQAAKDSEILWSLKRNWRLAGKKDRAAFTLWMNAAQN